jgi:hypothetical protein
MSATPLEALVKETRHAFIIAKSDGVLDSGEVIQIAVGLAQKIQALANLSGAEKKALLLLTLKKGLDASGGLDTLPGFTNASAETKQALEDQLLTAASTTIDVLVSAAQGKIQLSNPKTWLSCLFPCLTAIKMALPKDMPFLQEATAYAEKIVKTETAHTAAVEEIVAVVTEEPAQPAAQAPAVAVESTIPGTVAASLSSVTNELKSAVAAVKTSSSTLADAMATAKSVSASAASTAATATKVVKK